MSVAEAIERKVRDALPVAHFDLQNESHRHSVPANSETHFKLVLVSEAFAGLMLVRRHQQVYQLLEAEMSKGGGPVHALSLHLFTPPEWRARGGEVAASPDCRGGSKQDPELAR